MTPNGEYAYVSNSGDGTVSVIRTSDNSVIDTDPNTVEIDPIKVGNGPDGVSVTPNGKYVYVSNYGDGTVSIIKTSDNSVIDMIQAGRDRSNQGGEAALRRNSSISRWKVCLCRQL